jgi:hypothetical protein
VSSKVKIQNPTPCQLQSSPDIVVRSSRKWNQKVRERQLRRRHRQDYTSSISSTLLSKNYVFIHMTMIRSNILRDIEATGQSTKLISTVKDIIKSWKPFLKTMRSDLSWWCSSTIRLRACKSCTILSRSRLSDKALRRKSSKLQDAKTFLILIKGYQVLVQ